MVDLNRGEGYAAAQGPKIPVAIDTELTTELIREGWVRYFIRGVQDARKTAGLEIDDRIAIRYAANDEISAAITDSLDYIKAETLARTVEAGLDGSGQTVEVGDVSVSVSIERHD
jgi:isoleucyl-tRNA synthetase